MTPLQAHSAHLDKAPAHQHAQALQSRMLLLSVPTQGQQTSLALALQQHQQLRCSSSEAQRPSLNVPSPDWQASLSF